MISLLFTTFILSYATATSGFPKWVEQSAKLQTFDQLTKWSGEIVPYKINSVLSKEGKNAAGDTIQKIEISLNSDEKCLDRKMVTSCLPVGLHTQSPVMFCNFTLNECAGKILSTATLVK